MPSELSEKTENFFTELLKFVVVAAVIVIPIRFFVAQPFIVSGASMNPTFLNGQYLIVDELTYRFVAPERGDVIIFRYPKDPKEFYIKRIIGLPGETVTIKNGALSITEIGGKMIALSEPYVQNQGNGQDASYTIASDEYFVLGDNRPESSDSRIWGLLPKQNIIGRAIMRLLPVNKLGLFPGATNPQN